MFSTFILILPDFFLIALGWLLYRSQWLPRHFFNYAEQLVYYVFFPALLFYSVTQNPLTFAEISKLGLAVLSLTVVGVVFAYLAKPFIRPEKRKFSAVAQCCYRFNTYIAMSIAFAINGQAGLSIVALFVAISVPIVNVVAVYTLAQHAESRLFIALIKNPLILATLGGLIWNVTNFSMPEAFNITLNRLGASALPLGLLCVGASLTLQAIHGAKALISWVLSVRLVLMPLAALAINAIYPLSAMEKQMLLLFAAVPTAPASYVLAVRMGGDGALVALTLSLSTLLAAITLPLWMMIQY